MGTEYYKRPYPSIQRVEETINDFCFRTENLKKIWQDQVMDILKKCDHSVIRSIIGHLSSLDKDFRDFTRRLLSLPTPKKPSMNFKRSSQLFQRRKDATKLGVGMVLQEKMNWLFRLFKNEHISLNVCKTQQFQRPERKRVNPLKRLMLTLGRRMFQS
ncbi:hypothetical protein PoB_000811500 [Plakobranchus ocellatus]|uniref:Uncharacterized protein n=1 Tax=Plakobranchus ocellatus TaxID=259542 RepID=A0AAV3YGI7_9GAST|nr:hypothetical protein PoB_000811500 [Plakobranchus ocellatus]